jgi:thymidine kinase
MSDFTLIYGSMFSGKTTRLIEVYNLSEVTDNEKLAVKPLMDNRYVAHKISSHGGLQLPGHRISKAEELYPLCNDQIKEVYIDEVQFLGKSIPDVILGLLIQGVKVVASGLDLDYLGRPFGEMPRLLRMAKQKIQLQARCHVCGKAAFYTFRQSSSEELILVGHTDMYESRCKTHWEEGMGQSLPEL